MVESAGADSSLHQWMYFQFHGDTSCTSYIDYVHGVRVNECHTDSTFLKLWKNVNDAIVSSYRMRVKERDDVNGELQHMWMETYMTADCSDKGMVDVGLGGKGWNATDTCHDIVDALTPLGRFGHSVVLHVVEDTKTPEVMVNQFMLPLMTHLSKK
jgi:hypothetical protein